MRFAANATRMELLKIRKRLVLARRGHKLLRDKQDELMRRFMCLLEEWKSARKEMDTQLKEAFRDFIIASSLMDGAFLNKALKPAADLNIICSTRRFLNLDLPKFEIASLSKPSNYSLLNTNSRFDIAISRFYELVPNLMKVAELEKSIFLVSREIKSTRRRVNALEHVLIPGLIETIKYITMKLGEFERSNLTRLMRVKELIRSH